MSHSHIFFFCAKVWDSLVLDVAIIIAQNCPSNLQKLKQLSSYSNSALFLTRKKESWTFCDWFIEAPCESWKINRRTTKNCQYTWMVCWVGKPKLKKRRLFGFLKSTRLLFCKLFSFNTSGLSWSKRGLH